MATFSFDMVRGDTRTITITASNPDSTPYVLTGKTVRFTAKRKITDADTDAVISKVSGSGITVMSNPNDNKAVIAILPADTDFITNKIRLMCDVQIKDGSNVYTVATGTLTINPDVTRTTT